MSVFSSYIGDLLVTAGTVSNPRPKYQTKKKILPSRRGLEPCRGVAKKVPMYNTKRHLMVRFQFLGIRAFANKPGDRGSIPCQVIPKTQKMVLDASLLNTQHYKVWIKGKVGQSWERSSALPYTL